MKKSFFSFLFYWIVFNLSSQEVYNEFFYDKTLRIDFIQAGNADTSYMFLRNVKQEPYWGGSKINLIDTFQYGTSLVMVYDSVSSILLYSRGYATLFSEWKTIDESKHIERGFEESVIIPYPKNTIKLCVYIRDKMNNFILKYSQYINPHDNSITRGEYSKYKSLSISYNGDPAVKVDVVFLPEGYKKNEIRKFKKDAKRFMEYLFGWAPFDQYQDHFNFWIVEIPSDESGTDIPQENIWVNTAFNTSFNTFGIERYLTTQSIYKVRDAAGFVPYDQICILVNTDRFGGGGIYNFFTINASDGSNSEFVFCHEFGHSFASLADEYYESQTLYNNFYNLEVEPYHPNITTLINFDIKWKHLIDSATPIPTPPTDEFMNKIGVFEGAGYVEKGVYRPTYDSSMKSIFINNFGPVNSEAIIKMIRYYSE